MNQLINRFLNQNCTIYLSGMAGELEGTIESVEGNWISVKTKKSTELVNLDYISRIKEKVAK